MPWQFCKAFASLQHTATPHNTLQHTATHYNTLQHTATHCNTLQHTATHYNTLQQTATHWKVCARHHHSHRSCTRHHHFPRWCTLCADTLRTAPPRPSLFLLSTCRRCTIQPSRRCRRRGMTSTGGVRWVTPQHALPALRIWCLLKPLKPLKPSGRQLRESTPAPPLRTPTLRPSTSSTTRREVQSPSMLLTVHEPRSHRAGCVTVPRNRQHAAPRSASCLS